MRFYGFGNYYLSSLQQGLQAGHAACELFVKYDETIISPVSVPEHLDLVDKNEMVFDWARDHKTMVLLNGGNSADLEDLFNFLNRADNPYPYVKFHEDEASLNGALTYVGTILPEKIYEAAALLRANKHEYSYEEQMLRVDDRNDPEYTTIFVEISPFEYELIKRLNFYGLAK